MRGHVFISQPFAEVPRYPLSHAPGVDEDQGGLVLANQVGDAIIDFFPDFVRHQRFQRRTGNFKREIKSARVTAVDDCATRRPVRIDVRRADQKAGNFFDRLLGRR